MVKFKCLVPYPSCQMKERTVSSGMQILKIEFPSSLHCYFTPIVQENKRRGKFEKHKNTKKPDTLLRGKYSIETDPQMTQMLALTFKQ